MSSSPCIHLLYPVAVPEPVEPILFHDFIPAKKKDLLLKVSSNRKLFANALNANEASLINAEQIAVLGAAYLKDLFSLQEINYVAGYGGAGGYHDGGGGGAAGGNIIDKVPLLSWRSGLNAGSPGGGGGGKTKKSSSSSSSSASTSSSSKVMDNTTFKNFKDICHFEIVMTGLSIAAVKLAVAGFTLQPMTSPSASSSGAATAGAPDREDSMAFGLGTANTSTVLDQNLNMFSDVDLNTALGLAKEAACLYSYLVEFNGRLSCRAIEKELPEVDPRVLDVLKEYAVLCLNQVSFELARKKTGISKGLLASVAEQNRADAEKIAKTLAGLHPSTKDTPMTSLTGHCEQYSRLMKVVSLGYMAEQYSDASDFGTGEAFAQKALKALSQLKSGISSGGSDERSGGGSGASSRTSSKDEQAGAKKTTNSAKTFSSSVLASVLDRDVGYYARRLNQIVDDNSKIYFKSVPEDTERIRPRAIATVASLKYEGWKERSFSVEDLQLISCSSNDRKSSAGDDWYLKPENHSEDFDQAGAASVAPRMLPAAEAFDVVDGTAVPVDIDGHEELFWGAALQSQVHGQGSTF